MPDGSRERMVRAAVDLFRERGYAATSFSDVLERSGAPRGSIYHHFPGGKDQLASEAVQWYADRVARALDRAGPATEVVELFLSSSREALVASDFSAGCAVAAVTLDLGPGEYRLHPSVANAFGRWRTVLSEAFTREGATPAQARRLAAFTVAAVEGALILARAERSARPLDDVATELRAHLSAALA
jgi:AcrR family transcriptional regulator